MNSLANFWRPKINPLEPSVGYPIRRAMLRVLGTTATVLGWALALGAFGSIGFMMMTEFREWFDRWWLRLAALAGVLIVGLAGRQIALSGRRLLSFATQFDAFDPGQPFVLYLHSFEYDDTSYSGLELRHEHPILRLVLPPPTEENDLVGAFKAIGPVVAIGRPGERLPPAGARRFYAMDEEWRGVIRGLMPSAAVVVAKVDFTRGLWWELQQARYLVRPGRLVLYLSDNRRMQFGYPQPGPGSFSWHEWFRVVGSDLLGIEFGEHHRDDSQYSRLLWLREGWRPTYLPSDLLKEGRGWNRNQISVFRAELLPIKVYLRGRGSDDDLTAEIIAMTEFVEPLHDVLGELARTSGVPEWYLLTVVRLLQWYRRPDRPALVRRLIEAVPPGVGTHYLKWRVIVMAMTDPDFGVIRFAAGDTELTQFIRAVVEVWSQIESRMFTNAIGDQMRRLLNDAEEFLPRLRADPTRLGFRKYATVMATMAAIERMPGEFETPVMRVVVDAVAANTGVLSFRWGLAARLLLGHDHLTNGWNIGCRYDWLGPHAWAGCRRDAVRRLTEALERTFAGSVATRNPHRFPCTEPTIKLHHHRTQIVALSELPDGRLVSLDRYGLVTIVDLQNGETIRSGRRMSGTEQADASECWLAWDITDNARMARGFADGGVFVTLPGAKKAFEVARHSCAVNAMVGLPNGIGASMSADGQMLTWGPDAGQLRENEDWVRDLLKLLWDGLWTEHPEFGLLVHFSPGHVPQHIKSSTLNRELFELTLANGIKVKPHTPIGPKSAHRLFVSFPGAVEPREVARETGCIGKLCELSGGGFASCSYGGPVLVWFPSFERAREVTDGEENGVGGIVALEGGGFALVGTLGRIIVWHPGEGQAREVALHRGDGLNDGRVAHLIALPGGGMASSGSDARVMVWLPGDKEAREIAQHKDYVSALIALTGGGVASGGGDGVVTVWKPRANDRPVSLMECDCDE